MNIMITGRHIEVTDAIRAKVEAALSSVLADRESLKISSVRVMLDFEKHEGSVDILVSMKNHEVLGQAREHDLYKAVDLAVERLEAQIVRHVKRVQEHQATPIRDAAESMP